MTTRVFPALGAAILSLCCAPLLLAQAADKPADKPAAAAKPDMPKPAAEMAQLKYFDGSWTCEGTVAPSPMGPGGKMTTTVKSHTDLGGFWQSGMVKSSLSGTPAMEGMFHMTYEPGAKQFVMLWVDNMGAMSRTTSTGWTGNDITFEGETTMGGQKMGSRDVFTKNADGTLKHAWSMQMEGKWVPGGDEVCKKAAAPGKK